MSKKVILIHGSGGNPESCWLPYIKQRLENERGYMIVTPQMPHEDEGLDAWIAALSALGPFDDNTIIIGHSLACPVILSALQRLGGSMGQVLLVAGFYQSIGSFQYDAFLEEYNFEKLALSIRSIVVINSDNDPWDCTDRQGRYLIDHLKKGTLVVPKGGGHFGSKRFHDPCTEFPLLFKLID